MASSEEGRRGRGAVAPLIIALLVGWFGLTLCGSTTAAAQTDTASRSTWNDPRTRALVELATRRRERQLADTLLADYQADAKGYVTFLVQLGKGFLEVPKVVKVDQLASEVYWRAPNLSKQRIIGRRDSTILPTDIQYHRDHLGIVQNNFPNVIRLGDGDEVRDVPHPLSAVGLVEYDFRLTDSLRINLAGQSVNVLEVKVRPKDDRQPRVIGAVYIEPEDGQVVRMAFSFTRAAFLDKLLEDLAITLENVLVGTRFWLPARQTIEIRRTGQYINIPFRGIIRGRWEIGNYRFNLNPPPATFTGPEIQQAPPNVLNAYQWQGGILDALPPDIRATVDPDVKRIEEEARALVRAEALARTQRMAISAPTISEFVRVNRVEGLALGAGLSLKQRAGWTLGGRARFGLDDHEVRWTASLENERPSRSGVRVFASRDFRDVGDVQERSTAMNSLAAQEFGSDYTDPVDVQGVGVAGEWRKTENLSLRLTTSYERQRRTLVHATPVTGAYEAPVMATGFDGWRVSLQAERAARPWIGGSTLSWSAELRATSPTPGSAPDEGAVHDFGSAIVTRLGGIAEVEVPIGGLAIRSWTLAGGALSGRDRLPQERSYLGGPVTAPGYPFHAISGNAAVSQRLELDFPVPFPAISLGRFGRTSPRARLDPYVHATFTPAGDGPYDGIRPSAGIALRGLFDMVRIDVARGLRGGVWMFNVDVNRTFWSIL